MILDSLIIKEDFCTFQLIYLLNFSVHLSIFFTLVYICMNLRDGKKVCKNLLMIFLLKFLFLQWNCRFSKMKMEINHFFLHTIYGKIDFLLFARVCVRLIM